MVHVVGRFLIEVVKPKFSVPDKKEYQGLPMCTAIPYRASTGPEQGFPYEVFHTGKNLFSLQGTPVLIAGTLYSLQGISCENYYTGKSL